MCSTAHTLDDQAETVLIRLARGSGVSGLAGMARRRRCRRGGDGVVLVRPLLDVPKARLIATLQGGGIAYRRRSDQPRSALHPAAAARG